MTARSAGWGSGEVEFLARAMGDAVGPDRVAAPGAPARRLCRVTQRPRWSWCTGRGRFPRTGRCSGRCGTCRGAGGGSRRRWRGRSARTGRRQLIGVGTPPGSRPFGLPESALPSRMESSWTVRVHRTAIGRCRTGAQGCDGRSLDPRRSFDARTPSRRVRGWCKCRLTCSFSRCPLIGRLSDDASCGVRGHSGAGGKRPLTSCFMLGCGARPVSGDPKSGVKGLTASIRLTCGFMAKRRMDRPWCQSASPDP